MSWAGHQALQQVLGITRPVPSLPRAPGGNQHSSSQCCELNDYLFDYKIDNNPFIVNSHDDMFYPNIYTTVRKVKTHGGVFMNNDPVDCDSR